MGRGQGHAARLGGALVPARGGLPATAVAAVRHGAPWYVGLSAREASPVSVETLWAAREFERAPGSADAVVGEAQWQQLVGEVKTGECEPVMLDWDPTSGRTYLSEGNHRVAAAREAGVPELPCRVVVTSTSRVASRERSIALTPPSLFAGRQAPGNGSVFSVAAVLGAVEHLGGS